MSTMGTSERRTTGILLHRAALYDLQVWIATLGRARRFREDLVRLARLQPGESVLDVGSGTGSLAIAAKRRVGPSGTVAGIDASPEMLDRARQKARKAGLDTRFEDGVAETLPFPDDSFDVALATVMLHHLPKKARRQCAHEIRRVVKPGGRVLAVDFAESSSARKGFLAHVHRHGNVTLPELIDLFTEAGFQPIESGPVGISNLQFVLSAAPC